MHTIEVTSGYAFTEVIDRLSRIDGMSVINTDEASHRAECRYEDSAVEDISNAITNLLFHDWLYEYITSSVLCDDGQLTEDELEYVTIVCLHEIRSADGTVDDAPLSAWMESTKDGLKSLLLAHRHISLDGFARFRLRGFLVALAGYLREKAHQFILDREYEESVAMLRYMLDSQPQGRQELHVFCAPDRVWITDVSGDLLRDTEVTEAALSEAGDDLDSEDLAMSILITRSPCRIVLHNMHSTAVWPSFPDTLVRVFAQRVSLCHHCSTCQQLEQANHHLPIDPPSDHPMHRNR